MAKRYHAVVTEYGPTQWGVTSPQLPGLVGGRGSFAETAADLVDILISGGMPRYDAEIVTHRETPFDTPDGPVFVQVALDDEMDSRIATARRLGYAFTDRADSRLIDLSGAPRDRAGDVRLICAVPSDTLEWIIEQMKGRDDAVVVVVPIEAGGESLGYRQMFVVGTESADSAAGYQVLAPDELRKPLGNLIAQSYKRASDSSSTDPRPRVLVDASHA